MDEFLANLAEVLELEKVAAQDVLEDLPDWDSLAALSVIAMIGEKYCLNLGAADLRNAVNAEGLFRVVQEKGGA